MKYDFDKIIERQGTHCVKWDATHPTSPTTPYPSLLPLWVADMDFEAAPAIREAIEERARHGVFGYAIVHDSYYDSIISWFRRRHQWTIRREWIQYTTGVVPANTAVIKALTMPGEKVLFLTPAYNCFFSSVKNNGCEVLTSPLKAVALQHATGAEQLTYEIDWDDFEHKCADDKTTVFLLCNPHNPGGRVWMREELERMNDICMRHGVIVVSDEIHCELIMPGYTFTPFASVSEACADNCVVCGSPSKSFNIAGLHMSHIITKNPEWRRRIDRAININEICDVNVFGPIAAEAAYNDGADWIDALNEYLYGNYCALLDFCNQHMPLWKVYRLEGTYLVWVDITATGCTADELADRYLREANVWVNSSTMYGAEGHLRINIATQRSRLLEALERICACENTQHS